MALHEEAITLQTRAIITNPFISRSDRQTKCIIKRIFSFYRSTHQHSRRATDRSKVRQWLAIKNQDSACDSWKYKFIF